MAKKAQAAAKSRANPTPGQAKEIEAILDELKVEVLNGMGGKTFAPPANAEDPTVEELLRRAMRPKIFRRLLGGGVWLVEKKRPLLVAYHMGQIASLLATGRSVDFNVADAARVAVKSDENCPRTAAGGGDWCF